MPIARKQSGFTFVELAIAMAIISFLLLIITTAIVRLFNIYEAGIGIRATQQNARSIAEELSSRGRNSQGYTFTQATKLVSATPSSVALRQDRVCFFDSVSNITDVALGGAAIRVNGEIFYTVQNPSAGSGDADKVFELHRTHLNTVDVAVGSCPDPSTVSTTDDRVISSSDVSVVSFGINRTGPADAKLVDFELAVAARTALDTLSINYNEGDALGCHGTDAGNQYCSVTHIHSTATLREE